jgi:D-glycero-alpha-D-manno-heptose 1-phosphate guanylyltransferase
MSGLVGISAVILAGGLGTRLRSVVGNKPKVLAEVNGRPFLANLLEQLADAGIRRAVLCTGYMAELVSATFGNEYNGIELCYSRETAPLGTGGALRLALPLLSSSPVLVMNGDSYCDVNLSVFIEQHRTCGAKASLVLATVADIGRYGAVEVAPDSSITRFEEKGNRQGEGLINAGIYLIDRTTIASMPPDETVSLERDFFPALVGRGLYGFAHSGKFIDIGVPADYCAASAFFSGQG